MVENIIRQTSKKTWYRISFYVNIILMLIVGIFFYLLIKDSIDYGRNGGDIWLYITRDVAFLAIVLTVIFVQFIRNLSLIMKRSL
jgi:hypothetical protein